MGEAFSVPFIPSWSAEIKKTVTPVPWNVALRRDNIIRQKNICHLIFEYGVHILLFYQSLLFRKQKIICTVIYWWKFPLDNWARISIVIQKAVALQLIQYIFFLFWLLLLFHIKTKITPSDIYFWELPKFPLHNWVII